MKTSTEYWRYLKCSSWLLSGLFFFCLLIAENANAQTDSLQAPAFSKKDSVSTQQNPKADTAQIKQLDPRKALFYSAIFPGLGQMYNNKYWKLPFVYGGFVVTLTVVNFYQRNYVKYRDELYILLVDPNPNRVSISGKSEKTLRYILDKARRERDYFVIITGVWYLLQIVDAHVDAHLQEFKWNKELKISVRPSIEQNPLIGRTTGIALTFKF